MAHRSMIMVKRTYLHIAVISAVTSFLWLALSIYRSVTEPTDIQVDAALRAPINASFDEEVFNNLVSRENLSNLNFEPPVASSSVVTINEVSPATEDQDVVTEPTPDPATEITEVATP